MAEEDIAAKVATLLARGGKSVDAYPPEVRRLADALARIHGDVDVTTERGGIQLYIADPSLLMQDGAKELRSKHLAVSASKYLGLGQYSSLPPLAREKAASCMKTGATYLVGQLLMMRPLSERNIPGSGGPGRVRMQSANAIMIDDGRGNIIPDHPGRVIPVTELPDGHPALFYLRNRGFDPVLLHGMFRASWCEEQAPEVRGRRGYMRLVDGWANTPQGRVIFYGDVRGVQTIWQGRMLEHTADNRHYVWHPYRGGWVMDAWREHGDAPWCLVPPYDAKDERGAVIWKSLAKYFNAKGSSRLMCGFDAAVAWNSGRPRPLRFGVVTEGPLDAGKIGPPAMALVGKFMSTRQAELLASEFPWVLLGYDNDKAGHEQRDAAVTELHKVGVKVLSVFPDVGKKDWGDMTRPECWKALWPSLAFIR